MASTSTPSLPVSILALGFGRQRPLRVCLKSALHASNSRDGALSGQPAGATMAATTNNIELAGVRRIEVGSWTDGTRSVHVPCQMWGGAKGKRVRERERGYATLPNRSTACPHPPLCRSLAWLVGPSPSRQGAAVLGRSVCACAARRLALGFPRLCVRDYAVLCVRTWSSAWWGLWLGDHPYSLSQPSANSGSVCCVYLGCRDRCGSER